MKIGKVETVVQEDLEEEDLEEVVKDEDLQNDQTIDCWLKMFQAALLGKT